MKPDRLLKHFEQVAEAPDAVPRLRRFILDLAVRGKLVEQDPADEPASELLKRIEAKKKRLEKDGVIRTPKPLSPLDEAELLFGLPGPWRWIRLSEVGSIVGGGTPPSKDSACFTEGGTGVAWLTPADLGKQKSLLINHGERDLTEKGLAGSSAKLMPAGSVLFTSRAPIGYTAIAANEISTNQGFKSVVPFVMESNRYIAVYFKAFATWIDGKASGTTFKEVPGKIVANLPFPLPPLAEQHRIVAKVDELMALCDELEAARAKRETRRDRLVAATLHGLNNGDGSAEPGTRPTFEDSARFYFNHLPRLTTRPEHIHQLRQTILTLAVRGRLVPRDLEDEPASALLDRIRSEKNRLASAGSWNKQKGAGLLGDSALIFEVPESWEWTTYRELALDFRYGTSKQCSYERKGQPVLRIPNVSGGKITTEDLKFTKLTQSESEDLSLSVGDVLMIRSNGSLNLVGRPALVEEHVKGFCYAGYLVRVRFVPDTVDSRYLIVVVNSRLVRNQIEVPIRTAVGLKNVNSTELGNLRIPLPPLAEQHRIVAKVDDLMALCDELEARLTTTATTRRQLLEAALAEALST